MGDFDLTDDDVAAIDQAGAKGAQWDEKKDMAIKVMKGVAIAGLIGYAGARMLM